jgi:prepilin-type N-terminal cleavage/methylation domain-containing protein
MRMFKRRKKGFTVIELLIAMVITAMILIGAGSILTFLLKSNNRVTQTNSLDQSENDLQSELYSAVRWAKAVSNTSNSLTTTALDDTVNVYALSSGKITKNGTPVTASDIVVSSFLVENLSQSPTYASVQMQIQLRHIQPGNVPKTITIVASQRKYVQ